MVLQGLTFDFAGDENIILYEVFFYFPFIDH